MANIKFPTSNSRTQTKKNKHLFKYLYRVTFAVALFVFSINTAFVGITPQEAHAATHKILYPKTNIYVPSFTQIDTKWAKAPINDIIRKRDVPYYYETYWAKGLTYIVKKGDTANKIAQKYHTTLVHLQSLNPRLKANPNLIHPGWKVVIRRGKNKQRKVFTSPSTLGMYGCGITSLSMIFSHHGYKISPKQIAMRPGYFADGWGWDLLYWDKIYTATGKRFKVTPINLVGTSTTIAKNKKLAGARRDTAFKKKKPFMIWFNVRDKKGNYLGYNHYVVITGKNDKGKWMMNDPVQKGNMVFSYGYSNIVQYVFVDKQ